MSNDRNVLEAKTREGSGKGAARKLRAQGLIPAVVYGRHTETPAHVAVDPKAVRKAINTPHKLNTLLTLKGAGADKQVLLKDYQMDPLTRDVLHADFIEVRENDPVKVNVPVVLVGRAVGVAEGGILSQTRRELEVWSLPNAIPASIEVDITNLKIAQALHIKDITLPEGVKVKTQVNFTLATIGVPEREEAAAPAAAAAAPAAGAAAPAAGDKAAPAKADAKAPAKK